MRVVVAVLHRGINRNNTRKLCNVRALVHRRECNDLTPPQVEGSMGWNSHPPARVPAGQLCLRRVLACPTFLSHSPTAPCDRSYLAFTPYCLLITFWPPFRIGFTTVCLCATLFFKFLGSPLVSLDLITRWDLLPDDDDFFLRLEQVLSSKMTFHANL